MEPIVPNLFSTLVIQFGDQIISSQANPSPIDIKLQLYLDPSKLANIKFNYQQSFKTKIPEDSLVIEFEAKSQDIKGLIEKIEKAKLIKELMSKGLITNLRALSLPKSNKVCIFIESDGIIEAMSKLQEVIQKQSVEDQYKKQDVQIKIKSLNSPEKIKNKIDQKGWALALFDSLLFELKMSKNQHTTKVFQTFIGIVSNNNSNLPALSLLNSFKNTNLKLKFSSSRILQQFPGWKKQHEIYSNESQSNLQLLTILRNEVGNEARMYLFGSGLSIYSLIKVYQLSTMFQIMMKI